MPAGSARGGGAGADVKSVRLGRDADRAEGGEVGGHRGGTSSILRRAAGRAHLHSPFPGSGPNT